ncbi:hypothetical protein D3C76_1466110 [compost metagenome]
MNRSKSLSANTCGSPGLVIAQTGVRHSPRPAKSPPTARPLTKVRLDVGGCIGLSAVSLLKVSTRLTVGAFQQTEAQITVLTGRCAVYWRDVVLSEDATVLPPQLIYEDDFNQRWSG